MLTHLDWRFPLPRTHTGVPLGNALLGALVWGEGNRLRITLGRADLWDHRGGMKWTGEQNYAAIRDCLEKNDEERLRSLFETGTTPPPGQPRRPSLIPIGRVDLDLGKKAELQRAELNIITGEIKVSLKKAGKKRSLKIVMDMDRSGLAIKCSGGLKPLTIILVPSSETLEGHLESIGFSAPKAFRTKSEIGWTQPLPVDPAVTVACRQGKETIFISVERGKKPKEARQIAVKQLDAMTRTGYARIAKRGETWWKEYWKDVPRIDLPNDCLQELHDFGMYKFAGLCRPEGVPAGLQGPWIEDYQMPPWSGDYHFNINVQMCYWPAYRGNRLSHLRPLFDLIWSWRKTMRSNAKVFLDIDDGYMLNHAVDDRCTGMGGFWTGSIDHGCTAWMADMMYQYYAYTLDKDFLKKIAYPFMVGTMRVYEAMLEKTKGGYRLPVSVSPEYRGAAMNAWGANASFQLACIHRLCEDLIAASTNLGKVPEPQWEDILARLPKATIIDDGGYPRIALWEGTGLEESHRHHSHLAAISPFDTIDIDAPEWKNIVIHTLNQWTVRGKGLWSGWCVPWASMLNSRVGNGAMAELLLEIMARVFVNEGRGTLHDCHVPGFTLMGGGYEKLEDGGSRKELMQMDAGMGAVAAIQEMLLHVRRGVNYIFRGCPARWRDASFDRMRTEGGFLVSARRKNGETESIIVRSEFGGAIRIANPWDGKVLAKRGKRNTDTLKGDILELETKKGETVTLTRA